jgi:hypothetical protein
MSVGCYQGWIGTDLPVPIPIVVSVAPPEDEQLVLETGSGQ